MKNRRCIEALTLLLAFAASLAVLALPGQTLADTPPGWNSWPEAQPFRVMLRLTGLLTLVVLILLFIALWVARAIRTHQRRAR